MGQLRKPDYRETIKKFETDFKKLGEPANPKIHILVNHVPEFLDQYDNEMIGLGFFSEQVIYIII